jgi:O-antigen/teichoic acid export membrane protein
MSPARRILGTFFSLSAGELAARLVSFAAFAHLARVLGASDFGRIGLVLTIVTYLQIPVLQGFDSVGMRDVSRDRSLLRRYAGSILTMRLLAAVVTWGVAALLAQPPLRWLLLLFALTLFPQAASLKWAFQAVERARPVAAAGVVSQAVFAAGAFTVAGPEQLLRVPAFVLAGETAAALLLGGLFVRSFGVPRPGLDARLFRESAPLAASSVLGTLLFNFDVLALAWFQPDSAVGLYTAVYKLVLLFSTPLTLFQISLLPTLARAATGGASGLAATASPALRYLALVFLPLPFGGWLVAERLLAFLYGTEYTAGTAALRILLASLPWMAFRSLFRIILVSYQQQRLDLRTMLAGTLANVAVNLALTPRWGVAGAACATLASELVIFGMSYYYIRTRVERLPVLRHCGRPLAASAVMLAAGGAVHAVPLALQIGVAAAAYLAAAFVLRAVTWKEIAGL